MVAPNNIPNMLAEFLVANFVCWMVFILVSGLYLSFSKCPRCHKPFHMSTFLANPWNKSCLNCGLHRYEKNFESWPEE